MDIIPYFFLNFVLPEVFIENWNQINVVQLWWITISHSTLILLIQWNTKFFFYIRLSDNQFEWYGSYCCWFQTYFKENTTIIQFNFLFILHIQLYSFISTSLDLCTYISRENSNLKQFTLNYDSLEIQIQKMRKSRI